jgi:DNA-binding MarR family transcriptional regulator
VLTPRLEDAVHDAFVELTSIGDRYLNAFAEELSPGLRRGAAQPLLRLHRVGVERVSEVAAGLGLDATTVTRHLDDLESRGLITRSPDPSDRRATLVRITPHAVARLDAADADRRSRLRELLADWPADERYEFARLLSRFVHRPDLPAEIRAAARDARV